jgi:uncharacterized protein (DUF1800 family)
MMLYLDNKESIAPEIAQANPNAIIHLGQARGMNENFARELMELHTLGVNGGYVQKDVEQAARTFTGWSLKQTQASEGTRTPAKVELMFYPWAHDPNDKVVLGQTIKADGVYEVKRLLNILSSHPSTARHISFRLAQRFVSDNPPDALVDRMTQTFSDTDGDLREVMMTLLSSQEFLAETEWRQKVKSPLELAASAVRAFNGTVTNPAILAELIAQMGQPLYAKVEPPGYPNTGGSWINAGTLRSRMSFASMLANTIIPGVTVDDSDWEGKDVASIARMILGRDPSPETLEAIARGKTTATLTPAEVAGLIVASPEFQRR